MPGSLAAPSRPVGRTSTSIVKPLILAAIFAIAVGFVSIYVFRYYLHYNHAAYRSFWPQPRRAALLLHITCGTVALLAGPWQFSTRLRQRSVQLHRIVGRVYLISVALGSIAAFYLAITNQQGWGWGFGLAMLGVAWLATSSMAYYAFAFARSKFTRNGWCVVTLSPSPSSPSASSLTFHRCRISGPGAISS